MMNHRLAGVVLAVLVASACAGGEPGDRIPQIRLIGPPLLAHEIPVKRRISSEMDTMGFAMASTVAIQENRLAVLETGNHRIVVFDELRRPTTYIGREGAGPGELRGPIDMATSTMELAVSELNNGRVSVFDWSGRFRRSFSIPHGYSNVGFGSDGTLYVNAYDGRNYLLGVNEAGTLRPFGERPWDLYPVEALADPRSQISGYIHFAVRPGGTILVYDPVIGALVVLRPDGAREALHRLPDRIVEGLVHQSRLVARDFGGNPRVAPAGITDFSQTPDGKLLFLFPNIGAIGLLVNPSDWTAREIRWGPGLDPQYGGFRGVLRGDTLYRLSPDELRLFRLIPQ